MERISAEPTQRGLGEVTPHSTGNSSETTDANLDSTLAKDDQASWTGWPMDDDQNDEQTALGLPMK